MPTVEDARKRMEDALEAVRREFASVRTGKASPALLDTVRVDAYGSKMPLNQVANVNVEDSRTLSVAPWEKDMVGPIEKAIMSSDLGLNPVASGEIIRVPMPMLTEETRKDFIRQARTEAENARVSVRNIRRDANANLKDLLKEKDISEDDERKAADDIQKITDRFVAETDGLLKQKEVDLLEI